MTFLAQQGQVISGFVPVNLATAANPGAYISMKHYHHLTVIFHKGVGASGQDPTLTLKQATAIAGTGVKALNFTDIWVKQGASLDAIANFTRVTQAAGNTYTSASAGEAEAIWMLEIDGEDLDRDNGFDVVAADIDDIGSTSQIGSLEYILSRPRFAQASPPSAIVD